MSGQTRLSLEFEKDKMGTFSRLIKQPDFREDLHLSLLFSGFQFALNFRYFIVQSSLPLVFQ